ncbi:MAG: hypothetical protein ACQEQO_11170 [Thermodesulfobacteriota bacterium]|jgi:hypothetical protein
MQKGLTLFFYGKHKSPNDLQGNRYPSFYPKGIIKLQRIAGSIMQVCTNIEKYDLKAAYPGALFP